MKQKNLAYFIKKKLINPYTQIEFLDPTHFIEYLKKHGINLSLSQLENFEKDGLLKPILRLNVPENNQKKGGMMLGVNGIKWYYYNKFTEFPKKGDYEPWKNFKANYVQTKNLVDKKLMYYHPFQLLQVENIIEKQRFSFLYRDSFKDEDYKKIEERIKKELKHRKEIFHLPPIGQENKIGFLMMLEEPYRFQGFGRMSFDGFQLRKNNFELWVKWKNKQFSPQKLLEQSGVNLDEVNALYDFLVIRAINFDPIERWYDLTRIMRIEMLSKLKGDALKAQFYYNICRMIGLFLYDLTGTIVDEPDLQFDSTKGKWKEKFISNPFDYSTKQTQHGIIRWYVRDTTIRISILLEGETEIEVIKKICEKLDVNLEKEGINLVNYKGISNLTPKKIEHIIQISNQDNVPIFIIADNECNASNKINKIKDSVLSKFDFHIWNKDFEEDNFGMDKMMILVNNYLKNHNQKLTKKEISDFKRKNKSLVRSIELAYREKYHSDIFQKIPKKQYLSLELIKKNLKKIPKTEKNEKELPIEKVLHQIFRLHANWIPG